MEKIRLLIADDHPTFLEGLSRLLQEEEDLEYNSHKKLANTIWCRGTIATTQRSTISMVGMPTGLGEKEVVYY